MPIEGIVQPEIIEIDPTLRLQKYDGNHDFALAWYQDAETVYLVDGAREPYTPEKLTGMYSYLDRHGELYFIEAKQDNTFKPIGDVTFWQDDMPIVLGDPAFRAKGLGKKVVATLINRGRRLGYESLHIGEIYDWNPASQKCFTSQGFIPKEKTEKGHTYELKL